MLQIPRLDASAGDFDAVLGRMLARSRMPDQQIKADVQAIVDDIRARQDSALLEYTRSLDRHPAQGMQELVLEKDALARAHQAISDDERDALKHAIERIESYAERQKLESWRYTDAEGTVLGQQVRPLERVGLYVPGGTAAYPSSVLMNALPARVAGVDELILCTPCPEGVCSDLVLAAAYMVGIERVFTVGGAQAIAAMAYGTETIPVCDKIVGPGNAYVAEAKRAVYGTVDIDMCAGPSEICIVCDGQTDPEWVAMDLFAQAEHDKLAQALLLSWDGAFIDAVQAACQRLITGMARAPIITAALEAHGGLIQVADLDRALELVNRIAPEHLELSLDNAEQVAQRVRHAGAIFIGRHTPEVLGDYCAGPSHVLPTAGSARFSSPLGVYDFQKRTSLISCSPTSASGLAQTAQVLAHGEGLHAHAESARMRVLEGAD